MINEMNRSDRLWIKEGRTGFTEDERTLLRK